MHHNFYLYPSLCETTIIHSLAIENPKYLNEFFFLDKQFFHLNIIIELSTLKSYIHYYF